MKAEFEWQDLAVSHHALGRLDLLTLAVGFYFMYVDFAHGGHHVLIISA